MPSDEQDIYGLLAEFESADEVKHAAEGVSRAGYRRAEAYTPYAVDGLPEAFGYRRTRVPLIVLVGGILGGVGGYFMLWYANVVSYPWNIGGRPLNSWPAFIPITFEMTVLGAALFALFGLLILNGLPQPYHPLFNIDEFSRATQDRFFLCINSNDAKFDLAETRRLLESLDARAIWEVPW